MTRQVRVRSLLPLLSVFSLMFQSEPRALADPPAVAPLRPSQSTPSVPEAIPSVPPAVAQRLGYLMPRLQTTMRAWIADQARRQRALPAPNLESIRSAARTRFAAPARAPAMTASNPSMARPAMGRPAGVAPAPTITPAPGPILSAMDIESMVQLVMFQIAQDSEADLKDMLNEMQKQQKYKAELRDLQEEIRKEKASSHPSDTPCTSPNCRALEGRLRTLGAQLPPKARFTAPSIATMGDLAGVEDKLKDSLDSMSEIGEMESMRLQMAMDRMSKFMAALSNIEKKASDTSDAIITNLK
jgi:hypothetical protein